MTLDELRCKAITAAPFGEKVALMIPAPPSTGEKIRLCRTSGPRGDIVNVDRHGCTLARFNAKDILAWCDREIERGRMSR